MQKIQDALNILIYHISEQNYDQTFARYRLWFEITQTYSQEYPDQIFDSLLNIRGIHGIEPRRRRFIHPTAHLILRFAGDAESDNTLAPYAIGLQNRLCARILQEFFENDMGVVRREEWGGENVLDRFLSNTNLVAHWANLGYVEESTIRNHILQSLVSHSTKVYDHQVDALMILFKLAGATFEKYVDPLVVDHCFELLKCHYGGDSVKNQIAQVRVVSCNGRLEVGYNVDSRR